MPTTNEIGYIVLSCALYMHRTDPLSSTRAPQKTVVFFLEMPLVHVQQGQRYRGGSGGARAPSPTFHGRGAEPPPTFVTRIHIIVRMGANPLSHVIATTCIP